MKSNVTRCDLSGPPIRDPVRMNVDDLTLARRARMRWNTPLSIAHAELVLDRLQLEPGQTIVDLGCGWGELLMRAVERTAGAQGIGVDTDPVALDRGRAAARQRGLEERVTF